MRHRGPLHTVLEIRRTEERQARLALARALARAEEARVALGSPPAEPTCDQGLTAEDFLARRAGVHMAWAVFGARLGRLGTAEADEAAARAAWVSAAADLRSAERFVARRAQRARQEAARRAQRDMDEVAIARWGRKGEGSQSEGRQ